MFHKLKTKIKIKNEIFLLFLILLITIISTAHHNYSKKQTTNYYKEIVENIYFKKTLNHIFSKFEPRFKRISHKVEMGDTFDSILDRYNINKKEIEIIKKKLSKKVNLNNLNTNQKILFTIDQTNETIKEFLFQISNKEKIVLTQDLENKNFKEEIILTKLKKEILYKENIISLSLYKSAVDQTIPINVILDFARIYGFQVDFQRDIRKFDKFQIMYEAFVDEDEKIIETGNILFANLILSGEDNSLYFFDKEGSIGHYDKNGKSIQKALMKTPINGARLSHIGMRKHQ